MCTPKKTKTHMGVDGSSRPLATPAPPRLQCPQKGRLLLGEKGLGRSPAGGREHREPTAERRGNSTRLIVRVSLLIFKWPEHEEPQELV